MRPKIFAAALLAALLLPVSGAAQTSQPDDTAAPSSEQQGPAPEARVFLSALQAIRELHLSEPNDSTLWTRALEGLIDQLEDPYAEVYTPDEYSEFQEETTGNYAGIGVQITELNDAITVTAVFRGTPADRAGLQVGDVIAGVDGERTTDWTVSQASEQIRGQVGTTVALGIQREGYTEPISYAIERDQVHVSAVTRDFMADSIGYIHIDRVARNSAAELDSALTAVAGARGIIVDLRRNPGGYLEESLAMADLFVDEGEVLAVTRSRTAGEVGNQTTERFEARRTPRDPDLPVVILVDRFTASAAEILAGALQDYDRALVLGERTFGKGVVQSVLPLPHGRQLRLTTGSWYTPLGRSLHRERDSQGRMAVEEDPDTLPTVTTRGGRELVGGGGIFPDIEIDADTLKTVERELLTAAGRAEVPLTLRVQEHAFREARELLQAGREPILRDETFESLVEQLREAGLPSELLDDPVARSYLRWQARLAVADRAKDIGLAAEIRRERDPVLTEAIRLLEQAGDSQGDLFVAADLARRHQAEESGGTSGGGDGRR